MEIDEQLRAEVHQIWVDNAPFWDAYSCEGNLFHSRLVSPATGTPMIAGVTRSRGRITTRFHLSWPASYC